jgi:hypothetical protein
MKIRLLRLGQWWFAVAVRDVPADTAPVGRTIPNFVTDPIWSLRCWPVDVELLGQTVQIPALPAADWLAVLTVRPIDLEDIFPGMAPGGYELVDELLYSGELDLDGLYRIVLEIVGTVTGRPWWISMRLINSALQNWGLIGSKLAMAGVDAATMSLGAWIDAVFMIIVEGTPEDQLTMFFSKLEFPPPGFEPKEEITMDADAFYSAMADD